MTSEPQNQSSAKTLLDTAAALVGGDRQSTYGDKAQNHQNICNLWNAYLANAAAALGKKEFLQLDAADVAMMMALMKIARTQFGGGTLDSYVDGAAYVAIAGEISSKLGG